ncbi:unnamed protein product [Vitrella brassicaformis CCMP3155]|uniref:Uncharacterized protein n=1 Tax=Vitrella brassicaformis (strain CCMP3155) TaxID=1169540 RepID=A0A0G4FBR2_VITBC|nr:unnamed protein product [Vitrella brassicaformis CCMP3155]|eukprot:CEM10573.1 unnamed protein product [Vitrella brassicaformis CCMP3155]
MTNRSSRSADCSPAACVPARRSRLAGAGEAVLDRASEEEGLACQAAVSRARHYLAGAAPSDCLHTHRQQKAAREGCVYHFLENLFVSAKVGGKCQPACRLFCVGA